MASPVLESGPSPEGHGPPWSTVQAAQSAGPSVAPSPLPSRSLRRGWVRTGFISHLRPVRVMHGPAYMSLTALLCLC